MTIGIDIDVNEMLTGLVVEKITSCFWLLVLWPTSASREETTEALSALD